MSLREEQKRERQRRILNAAEDMIRRNGAAGLNMRELAEAAGVSLVTPYNLFESKRGVLQALLGRGLRTYAPRFRELESLEPLDRLYGFLDVLTDAVRADSAYHRQLLLALMESGDNTHLENHRRNSYRWTERAITQAVANGQLVDDTPVDIVATNILLAQAGGYQLWAEGTYSDEELRLRYLATVSGNLVGFATEPTRQRFIDRLKDINNRLSAIIEQPVPGADRDTVRTAQLD